MPIMRTPEHFPSTGGTRTIYAIRANCGGVATVNVVTVTFEGGVSVALTPSNARAFAREIRRAARKARKTSTR